MRKTLDRKASQEYQDGKRLLGALANSRGHRHEENAARLVTAALEMPREVGAALLASAEGYTPRSTQLIEAARERLGTIQEIAGALADDLPAPKTGPSRTRRRRKRKTNAAGEAAGRGRDGGNGAGRGGSRTAEAPPRAEAPPPPQAAPPPSAARPSRPRAGASPAPARRNERARAESEPTDAARRAAATLERVIVLLGIGFLAGFVTAISPCVLPVLPILLAGGATGRKPLRIVAGLVASFVVFTLFAAWLLDKLGLPADLLRNLAIALLFLVAATLLVPRLALALERPFARLTRFRAGRRRLPARRLARARVRPVRGAGARRGHGRRREQRGRAPRDPAHGRLRARRRRADGADRVRRHAASRGRLRSHAEQLRIASGVAIGLVALGFALNVDTRFQTALPGYTEAVPGARRAERGRAARAREAARRRSSSSAKTTPTRGSTAGLPDYGVAPALQPGRRAGSTASR